jgi:ribosomal protein L32
LQDITPTAYFWISATATFVLWGITCAIAFENPVDAFLNKILSDAKKQSVVESQMLDEKSELLDLMNETVIMNNTLLSQVKDIMHNVRTEVKEIQPLKENVEKLKTEINRLERDPRNFEENITYPNKCSTCGKLLLPEFKVCPYCGENIKLLPEKMISVREYR